MADTHDFGPLMLALQEQNIAHPIATMNAVSELVATVTGNGNLQADDLFLQMSDRFREGSAPNLLTARGQLASTMLQAIFALSGNVKYKVGMDGFGMHGGGIIILNMDNDYDHLMITRGDLYTGGTLGVIGGQGIDADMGDDFLAATREHGEEVGKFPFDRTRLFPFVNTQAWRSTDTRSEGFWVKAGFSVYLAHGHEIEAMRQGYRQHIASIRKDPEIFQLNTLSRKAVLGFVQDGKIKFDEQAKALLMVAITIPYLSKARKAVLATHMCPPPSMLWGVARELALPDFTSATANDNWRKTIDVDFLTRAAA